MSDVNLGERFALKEAIVRMRDAIHEARRSADYPYARVDSNELEDALDEIDRLMVVNGQIAKLWAAAEDRAPLPTEDALTETECRVLLQLESDAADLFEVDTVKSAFAKLRRISRGVPQEKEVK